MKHGDVGVGRSEDAAPTNLSMRFTLKARLSEREV